MENTVYRYEFRGSMKKEYAEEELKAALESCREKVKEQIRQGKLMTAALYHYEKMLFFYYEALERDIVPEDCLRSLTPYLESWPGEKAGRNWVKMYPIFYHAVPESREDWKRPVVPERRRGRIAKLKEEKLFGYVCHHHALVEEGLLTGDKYQFISLHEDILFSYFEEPKTEMNVKRKLGEESQEVKEWIAVDPESHFERYPEAKGNFLCIPAYFAIGTEAIGE